MQTAIQIILFALTFKRKPVQRWFLCGGLIFAARLFGLEAGSQFVVWFLCHAILLVAFSYEPRVYLCAGTKPCPELKIVRARLQPSCAQFNEDGGL